LIPASAAALVLTPLAACLARDGDAGADDQRGGEEDRPIEPGDVLLARVDDLDVRLGRRLARERLVARQPVDHVHCQPPVGGDADGLVAAPVRVGDDEHPGVLLDGRRRQLPLALVLAGVLGVVAVLVDEGREVRLDRRVDRDRRGAIPLGVDPAGARQHDRRALPESLQRRDRRVRRIGRGDQVGAIADLLVGAAGVDLLVRELLGLELEVQRPQHLVQVDLVLGIEGDEYAAAAIDVAVDRRQLLGLEGRTRSDDRQRRDVLRHLGHQTLRRADGAHGVGLVDEGVAQERDAGPLVGVALAALPGPLAVPQRKCDRARRLDDRHQALLDLLVQRLERALRALHLLGQAQLLVPAAADEDQDAVGGDAVFLRLDRVDVEVVVRDLELGRLLGEVAEVVVHLVAHLVRRREEDGDLDRLIQVARDPARHLAGARGPEVGEVHLLVAFGRDVRERERRRQHRGDAQAGQHRAPDPAQLQPRRPRHL
jgi:hypothetical protein